MARQSDVAEPAIRSTAGRPERRPWQTPRVIVTQMSKAEHNSLVFVTDHTQLGGSASGTLNS